ncbi:MAG: glycosyltransferase family 9 protein [bacterium]
MKFLIIRRDNIGDLICTTPFIEIMRRAYPDAQIDALVNSYNIQVLENNHYLDNVYAYTKAKHRDVAQSKTSVYWQRLKLLMQLRRVHYDFVILAQTPFSRHAYRLARIVNPRRIVGYCDKEGEKLCKGIALPKLVDEVQGLHEVERVLRLLSILNIRKPVDLPCMTVHADMSIRQQLAKALPTNNEKGSMSTITVGIHISARKPQQRWSCAAFVELIQCLNAQYACRFLVFWAPGDADNSRHPGDDQKAEKVLNELSDYPVFPIKTVELRELISGIDLCDYFICSDGGAMHIAAGLGKPIVCFFGNSDAKQWFPWGVRHQLLQPDSEVVDDITVEQVLKAFGQLLEK